jgi:hypothetical protein
MVNAGVIYNVARKPFFPLMAVVPKMLLTNTVGVWREKWRLFCELVGTVILVMGQTASTHVLTVDLFSFAGECDVTKETCVIWW